jgi:hypothetical protein
MIRQELIAAITIKLFLEFKMTSKNVERPRLPRKRAAYYCNRSKTTFDKYASKRTGPPYHFDKGQTYYWVSDLDEFKKSRDREKQTF